MNSFESCLKEIYDRGASSLVKKPPQDDCFNVEIAKLREPLIL